MCHVFNGLSAKAEEIECALSSLIECDHSLSPITHTNEEIAGVCNVSRTWNQMVPRNFSAVIFNEQITETIKIITTTKTIIITLILTRKELLLTLNIIIAIIIGVY